jgi:hypothetical protein
VFVDGAEPGALLEVDVAQTLQTMVQTWLIFLKNLKDFFASFLVCKKGLHGDAGSKNSDNAMYAGELQVVR